MVKLAKSEAQRSNLPFLLLANSGENRDRNAGAQPACAPATLQLVSAVPGNKLLLRFALAERRGNKPVPYSRGIRIKPHQLAAVVHAEH